MTMETRILKAGEIEAPAGEIRFIFLPSQDLFSQRAERLLDLAEVHPLAEYLAFLARLADCQQQALSRLPAPLLPGAREQALCREHGMPLLGANSHPRDPVWQMGLAKILEQMVESALPTTARETIADLLEAPEARLEELADRVLAADLDRVPAGKLPFIAAALQVYWVRMAFLLGEQAFGRLVDGGLCPVCGSYPSAGIVRSGGAEQGLRYLCCSLCAAQWHLVRIKCSSCASTEGIDYFTLEGSNGAVKAESCAACGTYLKLLYLEKESRMEPLADDLATLGLDMLMGKEGKVRFGPNPYFHPGTV